MKYDNKHTTFFHMSTPIKDGLRKIAQHNHTTLSNLLEEGARLVIQKESLRMNQDMNHLKNIDRMVSY